MAISEKERRSYVESYGASGLTPVMFCKQHHIKVKTFYAWLKRYPCLSREAGKLVPSREESCPEGSFMPLRITDFIAGEDLMPERGSIKSLSDDTLRPSLSLCFKTPHFCLDVSLNMGEHFSEFKLILQAFQELK